MRFENLKISECRWSEFAKENWEDWDFIWEDGEPDWQGSASLLATKDGRFVYCSWSWGSCSGCDPWEDMDTDKAKAEFDQSATYFDNVHELKAFVEQVKYGKEFNEAVMDYIFYADLEEKLQE